MFIRDYEMQLRFFQKQTHLHWWLCKRQFIIIIIQIWLYIFHLSVHTYDDKSINKGIWLF